MKREIRQGFRPLKDLNGSSVWKGSAEGSLALLLLNIANLDLKDSSCWMKNENKAQHRACYSKIL